MGTAPRLAAALATALVVATMAGCARGGTAAGDASPPPAIAPAAPVLSSPRESVDSYLRWISYAYRVSDSDVASIAYSPRESVRVDSYVMYNRQRDRAIDQRLRELDVRSVRQGPTKATLAAREAWRYRYVSLTTEAYDGPWLTASYDTTYTLVRRGDAWLVDAVEATSSAPVR